MTIDFILVYAQIGILLLIAGREVNRPVQRNLVAIVVCGGYLVLVSGQAWWMLTKLSESGGSGMTHLNQAVSLDGTRLANFYSFLAVLFFWAFYWLEAHLVHRTKRRPPRAAKKILPTHFTYLVLGGWVAVMGALLIDSAGGFIESISNPGLNLSYGVTMFLILISVGKLPLLHKLACGKSIGLMDVGLFGGVLFLTLFNARLNTALILLQLVITIHYYRVEVSRKVLLVIPLAACILFLGFGLYREFASRTSGAIDQEALVQFFNDFASLDLVLDWFYGANVEAFAGFAGILTHDALIGGIQHDFGVSTLSVLSQFIPGALRNDPSLPLKDLTEAIVAVYPYDGSIIRSGLENAYANFAAPGVLAFGALLGYLTQRVHRTLLSREPSALPSALLSVQLLHLVRGTFTNAIFFGVSDLIMLRFYMLITRFTRFNLHFSLRQDQRDTP